MSIEIKATIRKWVKDHNNVIHGYFEGHPDLYGFCHTSRVVSCDPQDDGDYIVLTKSGNYYRLTERVEI